MILNSALPFSSLAAANQLPLKFFKVRGSRVDYGKFLPNGQTETKKIENNFAALQLKHCAGAAGFGFILPCRFNCPR
jgi:hypothetical protein